MTSLEQRIPQTGRPRSDRASRLTNPLIGRYSTRNGTVVALMYSLIWIGVGHAIGVLAPASFEALTALVCRSILR